MGGEGIDKKLAPKMRGFGITKQLERQICK